LNTGILTMDQLIELRTNLNLLIEFLNNKEVSKDESD
jgi:hypothetical protein